MNETVVKKIKEQLSEKQFYDVLSNTNKMPVWMASAFKKYQ